MNNSLRDEQLAAIAWADPGETTAALARRIGATYRPVFTARRRMAAAGGWWCAVAVRSCAECRQPLLANASTTRQGHVRCKRTQLARYQRYAYARRAPTPTPIAAVRTWREQHPDRYAAFVERAQERKRERWEATPPEVQAASLRNLHEARERDQALTYAQADRTFRRWSADEDALVLAWSEVADRELALELGRSLGAVHTRRCLLRKRASRAMEG